MLLYSNPAALGAISDVWVNSVSHGGELVAKELFFSDVFGNCCSEASATQAEQGIKNLEEKIELLKQFISNGCNTNMLEWK